MRSEIEAAIADAFHKEWAQIVATPYPGDRRLRHGRADHTPHFIDMMVANYLGLRVNFTKLSSSGRTVRLCYIEMDTVPS
jgi:hypothetical protein